MGAVLSFIVLSGNRAQALAATETITQSTTQISKQSSNDLSAAQQHAEVVRLRQSIRFYIAATSRSWAVAGRHIHSDHAERRTANVDFLRWDQRLWRGRWLTAKHYLRANPWARMLRRTFAYRMCVIRDESANSGRYKAENGGTRYVEGPQNSNASGAYQFLDSTWQSQFANAKRYFKGKLRGPWYHAADAPPKVQDIVAAYVIAASFANGHGPPSDWQHPECQAKGMSPA